MTGDGYKPRLAIHPIEQRLADIYRKRAGTAEQEAARLREELAECCKRSSKEYFDNAWRKRYDEAAREMGKLREEWDQARLLLESQAKAFQAAVDGLDDYEKKTVNLRECLRKCVAEMRERGLCIVCYGSIAHAADCPVAEAMKLLGGQP